MNGSIDTLDTQRTESGGLVAPRMVLLLAVLAGLTDLKLGPVKFVELYVFVCFCVIGIPIIYLAWTTLGKAARTFTTWFFVFVCVIVCTSLYSFFTSHFSVPSDAGSLLNQPGWISMARILQLLIAFFSFLAIHVYCERSSRFLSAAVRAYILSAGLYSVYGIVSWILLYFVGIDLGGAYGEDSIRLRGPFVEGGPFGIYAASAILLSMAQRPFNFLSRGELYIVLVALVLALLLAQSKAATIALLFSCLISVALVGLETLRRHSIALIAVVAIALLSAVVTDTGTRVLRILDTRELLADSSEQFGSDVNVAMGRIAGAIIVPAMIEAHPLIGIGIGNYSLLRDSDEYLSGLPAVDSWDLHGLGLLGLTAEIGFLGLLPFLLSLASMIYFARSNRPGFLMMASSCFPSIALLFGTQPTFIYPWVLMSISLSLVQAQLRARLHVR